MELQLYQIDAFANRRFEGNPAAVCPLEHWLDDALMQAIAAENNLAETAFFVPRGDDYEIRWFTPTVEVDLCGHATLASAWVLFNRLDYPYGEIRFHSRSGLLSVRRDGDWLELDFPAQPGEPCAVPEAVTRAFKAPVKACLKSEDYVVVFEHEQDVLDAEPDLAVLKELGLRGVIITAPSERYDFVSRCFFPNQGIDEDPVTGSSFTQTTPYWAEQLGKTEMSAKQVSRRGGEVGCTLVGDRVRIRGQAVQYLVGTIHAS